jgi:hypothetical protein
LSLYFCLFFVHPSVGKAKPDPLKKAPIRGSAVGYVAFGGGAIDWLGAAGGAAHQYLQCDLLSELDFADDDK